MTNENIPNHIAFIADGNRRWAKAHGLPTLVGHKEGFDNLDDLGDYARSLGIKCVTAWLFSTENWTRNKDEVDYLFNLGREKIAKYKEKCMKEEIRFIHLGRKTKLPQDIIDEIIDLEEKTKHFTEFTFGMALDYGGHDELLRTIETLTTEQLPITKENIESHLDTRDMPTIDLIIRPGGEKRLSGFMAWQVAYAELYFCDDFFPDFKRDKLDIALADYAKRERRFGGNSKK